MNDAMPSAPQTDTVQPLAVSFADIEAASSRLAGKATRTPVVTSRSLSRLHGCSLYFKCENMQRAGAFKFRGAYNALSALSDEEKRRGVVAFSSGNHAQAMALAGRLLNIPVTIVMPEDAPKVKINATREYGAEIILYDRKQVSRETLAGAIQKERGLTLIPPFNHPHVIAGQGTAAVELFEEVGALDYLFVPCGGGGLISGCAVAASVLWPACRVVGGEPEAGDDATRSFRTRELQTVRDPDTIADGARTPSLGTLTFPIILRLVHEMVLVSDVALVRAMTALWERTKLVVEPTGALGAAAVFESAIQAHGARVGVILSGGNVDLRDLTRLMRLLD